MIVPTMKIVNLLCLCLMVPSLLYSLVTQFWNLPVRNGRGFFLGVQVAPGFYEGRESRWLARYHAMLVTVHLVVFVSLAVILAVARWDWLPIWAGSTALFLTASVLTFTSWARRRLGDYLSWPCEIFCIAVVGCSWWMLLRHGAGHIVWRDPVWMTWAVLGLLSRQNHGGAPRLAPAG